MTANETTTTSTVTAGRFARLRAFLIDPSPSVQEVGERRRAQLLAILSLIMTAGLLLGLSVAPHQIVDFGSLIVITSIAYALSRTTYYRTGIYLFCFGFTAYAFLALYLGTVASFSAAMTTNVFAALVIASILLSSRNLLGLVLFVAAAAFTAPLYSQVPITVDNAFYRDAGTIIVIGAILVGANAFRAYVENERIRELNSVNRELATLMSGLEQRVSERTTELETVNRQTLRRAAQLQAVTEVSESIAQLRDLEQLFPAITRQISERFGFYHVGIFLVDEKREYAVLQAANSEGGQRMLERQHRLKLGVGVVGFCAQTGQPRIALDVGADAVYFNNPDLPQTRSEAALPLKVRGETIGVLDVQSTEPSAFSSEDLQVLTALANQVSITLENTRLLTETRAALQQVQEVYNEFTRTEWSRTIQQTEQPGFRYQGGRIEMLEDELQNPEVISAIQSGEARIVHVNGSTEPRASVAVPVKLRGQVIGVLHVESNDVQRQWQAEEVSLVQAVAERAAFAMENARLFQDARRRAAKERMISEASARISSALDIENILRTTAEELERVLGGSEILIQFQSKEKS